MPLSDTIRHALKESVLTIVLVGLALTGPMVAYAGISVVYPDSFGGSSVKDTPGITFSEGTDWDTAQGDGFLDNATMTTDGSSTNVEFNMNGLIDGEVTIDDAINVSLSGVSSFKLDVTGAASSADIDIFEVCVWTGTTTPSSCDSSESAVCIELDLTTASESSNACSNGLDAKVMIHLKLKDTAAASLDSDATFKPSSITYS